MERHQGVANVQDMTVIFGVDNGGYQSKVWIARQNCLETVHFASFFRNTHVSQPPSQDLLGVQQIRHLESRKDPVVGV